jgi:GNAT superfamily N-acetyltransferase
VAEAIVVRPCSDADVAGVAALSNVVYPEYRFERDGPHGWRAAEQYERPNGSTPSWVAMAPSGLLVAYGAIRTNRLPWARMDLMVHPLWRRRGIGGRVFDRVREALADLSDETVHCRVRSDHADALRFAERRGFVERHRMVGLEFDTRALEVSVLRALEPRMRERGIEVATWAQERECDPACVERLFALDARVRPEWADPDPAPPAPPSPEAFARALAAIGTAADRFYVAKAGGAYVGDSSLVALGTAVHPDFRGRGIGTTLKALVLLDARARGFGRIITCTANPAMRAINEARVPGVPYRSPAPRPRPWTRERSPLGGLWAPSISGCWQSVDGTFAARWSLLGVQGNRTR